MDTEDYKKGNKVKLVHGGKEFFDTLLAAIHSATKYIVLQTYIFVDDDTGKEVLAALIAAQKKGISVCLMLDAYGSKDLSRNAIEQIKNAGIQFRFFAPFFKGENLSWGRRLHHKILVIDDEKALLGGINIEDKYNETLDHHAWLDFAVMVSGPVVNDILYRCEQLYKKRMPVKNTWRNNHPPYYEKEGITAKILVNDYLSGKREIAVAYRTMISEAKENIIIAGSYFLPGKALRKRLKNASKRGVKIKIILTRHSDVGIAEWATKFLYHWILRNNIEIFEWKKSILHAKVAVIDNHWSTVGSHNLNFLSDYESIEMNLAILNDTFAREFSGELENIISTACEAIDLKGFRHQNNPFKQWVHFMSFYILRYTWRLAYMISKKHTTQKAMRE